MIATRTPCFEDVEIGLALPSLVKGPLTTAHLVRWSAAMENWHRIHYDRTFAQEHDNLPDLLINGSLKQHFVLQLLKDWAGPHGWAWKSSFQFRAMNKVGETLTLWGRVTGKRRTRDFGLIDVDTGVLNEHGTESTPGQAVVALPYRNGAPVPYPFVAPVDLPQAMPSFSR